MRRPALSVIVVVFGAVLIALGLAAAYNMRVPRAAEEERARSPDEAFLRGRVARFWEYIGAGTVRCQLCPHRCTIPANARGRCGVRENRGGRLYSLVYGRPVALSVGPIEKAPFHHFFPGHLRRTIATAGCNLACRYCQNWPLSQGSVDTLDYVPMAPAEVIQGVLRDGLSSVSFTYTEPTVFFEYMYDIARLAKQQGLKTNLVTNGFINPEPLKQLLKYMDAVRVDLKAFTEEYYRQISFGRLEPVLQTLRIIHAAGAHLEIINLVVPTLNDNPEDIRRMCEWIVANLGSGVPVHFNRFFPQFQMTHLPPTPVETLEMAVKIAQAAGMRFVYIGNVPGHPRNNTFCPSCKEMVIQRVGLMVVTNKIEAGECGYCGYALPGVWGQAATRTPPPTPTAKHLADAGDMDVMCIQVRVTDR